MLTLSVTFMAGIVIGVFIPGVVMRLRFNNSQEARNTPPPRDRFERMLYRIVEPDSMQVKKIKPLAQQTSAQIDSLQENCNKEIKIVIDSLKTKLQPILTSDQYQRLEDFGKRRGGPPRGPGDRNDRDRQGEGSSL